MRSSMAFHARRSAARLTVTSGAAPSARPLAVRNSRLMSSLTATLRDLELGLAHGELRAPPHVDGRW